MSSAYWTDLAQADMALLDDQYRLIAPEYALRVGRAALAAGRFLSDHPHAGPVLDGNVRKWKVSRTAYLILYRIVPDGVEVLRMHHGREDWRPTPL